MVPIVSVLSYYHQTRRKVSSSKNDRYSDDVAYESTPVWVVPQSLAALRFMVGCHIIERFDSWPTSKRTRARGDSDVSFYFRNVCLLGKYIWTYEVGQMVIACWANVLEMWPNLLNSSMEL
ncbi:hypothetical protein ACFXTI_032330 [Malus domestica]